jgi:hypothetical protein
MLGSCEYVPSVHQLVTQRGENRRMLNHPARTSKAPERAFGGVLSLDHKTPTKGIL